MVFKINNVLQPTDVQTKVSPDMQMGSEKKFANTLKNAIAEVNNEQITSDTKTAMLATGKDIDLHEVMMAAQKASITLETAVQVQKKMLDAYNEVMRMQI